MVYSGEEERVREFMAMGPERSKPLHNFTLPCLKWGSQKHLRCMKVDDASNTASTAAAADQRNQNQYRRSPPSKLETSIATGIRRRESESPSHNHNLRDRRLRISKLRNEGEAEGIEAVREKIMKDLKTAADKMKDAMLREEVSDGEDEELEEPEQKVIEKEKPQEKEREQSPAVEVDARPWNLRTRRAACKAPIAGASNNSNKGLRIEERKVNDAANSSPMRNEIMKSPKVREKGTVVAAAEKERPKFSVSLSKKEIEEDFMEMLRHRPPRRPKKRPRAVQKQLDSLFPGLWLTEVSAEAYKVPESAENGKR
ncbi:hypothetical protein SLEP1_g53504 [Rubroshorea leprosula]|uniref:DUF1639 family protein n=1 Tax=Rubroshorea leprosula TaxID=152421 RepID=A0AAV5MCE4_9ROSI|nr:hypothetical protein SLEP1_g53504 [Rubroshorea leprosula]